ncbi:hypothetical protein NDU88_005098 [Pleurodeles waltl]|uniref:Prolactin receptor n=1 Tax=Pleurodeles waltl TaxID=8319 RepID=A0AAV7WA44_PLEWA|nr:hypothetical protein NDU88_005098 [Pleurodeles waltl]
MEAWVDPGESQNVLIPSKYQVLETLGNDSDGVNVGCDIGGKTMQQGSVINKLGEAESVNKELYSPHLEKCKIHLESLSVADPSRPESESCPEEKTVRQAQDP